MPREYKTFPFAELKMDAAEGPGLVSGYGSVFGGVDSYGDTIDPGAYAETIPEFLRDGFIAWGHSWDNPIATPVEAREDGRGLYISAQFHTHDEAQRARTITTERLARGKTMGLSIGYEAEAWEMRKVETPVRTPWGDFTDKVRALTKIKLFEVSLVTVPADSAARVSDAKGYGLSYEDHSERVRVAVSEFLQRSRSGSDARLKEGRAISEARRQRMAGVRDALRSGADEIDSLLTETAPPEKAAPVDLSRLRFDFDRTMSRVARELGVPA